MNVLTAFDRRDPVTLQQQSRPACRCCGRAGHLAPVSPDLAMTIAERHFGIDRFALLSHRRHDHLVRARAFVVWVLRTLGRPMSYPKIGAAIGGRDHATIINLHQKAIVLRLRDPAFRQACEGIETRFYEARSHSHVH